MTYTAVQVQTKTARIDIRVEQDLLDRVDDRRRELGQSRTVFIERALEKALAGAVSSPAASEPVGTEPASSRASVPKPARKPKTTPKSPEGLAEIRESLKPGGLPSIAPRHWA